MALSPDLIEHKRRIREIESRRPPGPKIPWGPMVGNFIGSLPFWISVAAVLSMLL